MRIFRFMSIDEFKNYLKGEVIQGKFAKGKACFLEGKVPSREKEPSVNELTDITSLNFTSTDFEGQMKELSELISPTFKDGNFDGELKEFKYLTLSDFMSKVRDGVTADILVEFETTEEFEKECNKVIMAYKNHLIEEIQANGYSINTLNCVSYKLDLINGFKDGIGVDTIPENMFLGVEHTLEELERQEYKKQQRLPISSKIEECIIDNARTELGQDVISSSKTLKYHVKELQDKDKVAENPEVHEDFEEKQ